MPRIRSIKPEFFLNDELGQLDIATRHFFIGLWTQADREGRLKDRPMRLKASIFPYDDIDVEGCIDALVDSGHITRYAVSDQRFIQIVNFKKHQAPHVKEQPSNIPAPDMHGACTGEAARKGREGKGEEGKGSDGEPVDNSRTLANFPACLTDKEFKGRTLSANLIDALGDVFGPTWTLRQTNLGKIARAITDGCTPDCKGDCAAECASAVVTIAEKHGPEKIGLVFHAIANDPRPWAERGIS